MNSDLHCIHVKLWNEEDPSAVEATAQTIRMLGGELQLALFPVEGTDDVWCTKYVVLVKPENEGFLRFAMAQQGYVKEVLA